VRIPTRLLLATALAALPAFAIVTRPDRDDAEYLELASRYGSALALGGYGEGVLIAPRWILTSADVANALRAGRVTRLRVGGGEHEIRETLVAPESTHGDIALILLREPVAGIEPTPLHRERDERGKPVVIASHGASGTIGGSSVARDGRQRAAINTIERVDDATFVLEVKKPDDASDLQGAAAAGDEGAPAYIEAKGRLSVAGIAQGPRGGAIPRAGDEDVYTRVSAFVPWIEEAMFNAAAAEAAAATQPSSSSSRRRGPGR
jgi:hypothetical protein